MWTSIDILRNDTGNRYLEDVTFPDAEITDPTQETQSGYETIIAAAHGRTSSCQSLMRSLQLRGLFVYGRYSLMGTMNGGCHCLVQRKRRRTGRGVGL